MSTPVQLSDLDSAPGGADDADLALVRRSNTTDYKTTVASLRAINVSGLPSLPATAQAADLMMIYQSGSLCKIPFGSVGFIAGTQMWFYQSAIPNGSATYWQIVPGSGDTLLAVVGGSTYLTAGTNAGNWQQEGVGGGGFPGGSLSIAQMPSHTHEVTSYFSENGQTGIGGGDGNNKIQNTLSTGGGQPHQHGNTWRPLASVGAIYQKK